MPAGREFSVDSFRYGGGNLYPPVGSLIPRIPADCDEFGFVLNQPTDGPLAESPEFGQLFHAEMRFDGAGPALGSCSRSGHGVTTSQTRGANTRSVQRRSLKRR
jgi:hypothetical protein